LKLANAVAYDPEAFSWNYSEEGWSLTMMMLWDSGDAAAVSAADLKRLSVGLIDDACLAFSSFLCGWCFGLCSGSRESCSVYFLGGCCCLASLSATLVIPAGSMLRCYKSRAWPYSLKKVRCRSRVRTWSKIRS
jgi:hypothetical protein